MKPLDPFLSQVSVGSKTFDYLSKDVLVEALCLHAFQLRDPCLLFRKEYRMTLNQLESWKGVPGVVVTGYPGIGTSFPLHKMVLVQPWFQERRIL
jgi:hypothetical protein